eukprot:5565845-Prymnesium_polylepis.1
MLQALSTDLNSHSRPPRPSRSVLAQQAAQRRVGRSLGVWRPARAAQHQVALQDARKVVRARTAPPHDAQQARPERSL